METGELNRRKATLETTKLSKSYFDVLGICCSSEIPLVEKILAPLEGVKEVTVVVASRTVIVLHDEQLISQSDIAKKLNQARLEASVRVRGQKASRRRWPSPFAVACGALLLLSLLKYVYRPLQWFAIAAVVVGIFPIALKAASAIRSLRFNISILVLITAVGTIFLHDYAEAATVVFLFVIADWLESRAGHKATEVMSSLMCMAPQKAVIADSGEVVSVEDVKVNTVIAVKEGDLIPVDGVVVEGRCEVDEKFLTGESSPKSKQLGSTVWAGTINLNGHVCIKTTVASGDCVVARIARLVEEAQNKKSSTQRLVDKCTQYYTPAIIVISAGIAVLPLVLHVRDRRRWFLLALVVLVSACPCALVLSTPVAAFCALSKAATNGILVKGGDSLETLAKIKTVAFDKTGTLTKGDFTVKDFRVLQGSSSVSVESLLYWVSSLESESSHPMAAALVDYARSRSIDPRPELVEEYVNIPGEGIRGKIDGVEVRVGNGRAGGGGGVDSPPPEDAETGGETVVFVYVESRAVAVCRLSDSCRSGVGEAVRELKRMGIRTAMLTGDGRGAALRVHGEAGNVIDDIHAELLPEDKAEIIRNRLMGPVAMVGDGVNDAAALATADVGISMGVSGSALASQTGNVILMSNDMRKIPQLIRLAGRMRRKIIENIAISVAAKGAILALAFAGHPLVWAAVLADTGTCIIVILNSMLLLRRGHSHNKTEHGHHHHHNCGENKKEPCLAEERPDPRALESGTPCCRLKDKEDPSIAPPILSQITVNH